MSSEEVYETCGDFKVYFHDSDKARPILNALLPDPDAVLDASGEPYESAWIASPTDKGRIRIDGQDYFYKRYPGQGLVYGLKSLFRASKAIHSFRVDPLICAAGIPTSSPLVCLEERRAGVLKNSYLIFPFASERENLLTCWTGLETGQRQTCLLRVAGVIGRMHRHGILHGDLNWRNVMIGTHDLSVSLVDFDGCQCSVPVSREKGLIDLKHFFRDMDRNGLRPNDRERFVESWEKALEQRGEKND